METVNIEPKGDEGGKDTKPIEGQIYIHFDGENRGLRQYVR